MKYKLSALGGILFVACVVATFTLLGDGPPENVEGASKYYDDLNVGAVLALLVVATAGLTAFAAAFERVIGCITAISSIVAGGAVVLVSGMLLVGMAESANELKDFS